MEHKGKLLIASSMRTSAMMGFLVAVILLLTFSYSFLLSDPSAIDAYGYLIQSNHHSFVYGGRWYFLAGACLMFAMAIKSLFKANTLERDESDA